MNSTGKENFGLQREDGIYNLPVTFYLQTFLCKSTMVDKFRWGVVNLDIMVNYSP